MTRSLTPLRPNLPPAWPATAAALAALLCAQASPPRAALAIEGVPPAAPSAPSSAAAIVPSAPIDQPPPPGFFPEEGLPDAVTALAVRAPVNALLRDGASAFAASALATAALHPVDTVKCRLQSAAYTVEPLCPGEGCLLGMPVPPGVGEFFRPRLRRRRPTAAGPRQRLYSDVYKGLGANVLKEAPDAAVYLASYESLSHSLLGQPWWASHVVLALLIAGALGDAAGSVLRLPAEVLAKRLQTGAAAGAGVATAAGGIEEIGVGNLLAETPVAEWLDSWAAILGRDVPFGGLQVAFFEEFRQALHLATDAVPDALTDVTAGIIAGAAAAALTTPLDVLVTHTLTTSASAAGGEAAPRLSVLSRARELVAEQGPATLMRGLGLRILYYAPQIGLFFGFYEFFRSLDVW